MAGNDLGGRSLVQGVVQGAAGIKLPIRRIGRSVQRTERGREERAAGSQNGVEPSRHIDSDQATTLALVAAGGAARPRLRQTSNDESRCDAPPW